jgi:hypothetical protein
MAKEAKIADNVIETPQQEKTVNTAINKEPAKPSWEIKDRVYYLLGNKSPLTLKIPGRHTRKQKQVNKERLDTQQTKTHRLLMSKKVK